MRKLLLSTTALATAAALTASAAVADVAITAASEWSYTSRSSQVALNDGSYMGSDSEIAFKFTNKTDSGLDIGYTVELESDSAAGGADLIIDESSISIAGGFGKLVLGNQDGAGDNYAMNANDALEEESGISHTGTGATSSISTSSDFQINNDSNKISYHLPAIGGFTGGVSFTDSGSSSAANAATDTTEYGAQFNVDVAGTAITIGAATGTTEAAVDVKSTSVGAKLVNGPITLIAATSTYKAADEDRDNKGFGIKYAMSDAISLGAYVHKSDDALDIGESLSTSGMEVNYTIASGLIAVVTVEDYTYKVDATNHEATPVADNGSVSKFTIKASF